MWLPFRRAQDQPAGLDPRVALLPPAEARWVVIDCELTGLDERRDSILSLGGVRVCGGRIELQGAFYEEVRPTSALTAQSIVVHGITPDQVQGKPAIAPVLEAFLDFCGPDILVGHFVSLDLSFLRKELKGVPGRSLGNPALDTWVLYDHLSSTPPSGGGVELPRLRDPRLAELARALGVESRGAHNALGDAYVTAQVFQRLLRQADRWGIATTRELLRAGDPRLAAGGHRNTAPPL